LDHDLKELFEPFGQIRAINIKTKIGSSNSYCFIDYENIEDATKAQKEYFCIYFLDLKVQISKERS
jgi:RNA recognition motif-containing protein